MTFYRGSDAHGLGVDVGGTVQTGTALYEAYQRTQQLIAQHPRDTYRLEMNLLAFQSATRGDDNAVLFLKQRSGRFPPANVDPAPYHTEPNPIGGWATATTQDDAGAKYAQALRLRENRPGSVAIGGKQVPLGVLALGGLAAVLLLRRRG